MFSIKKALKPAAAVVMAMLTLLMFVISAYAADVKVSPTKFIADAGQTVTVTLSAAEAAGLVTATMEFAYDTNYLQFVEGAGDPSISLFLPSGSTPGKVSVDIALMVPSTKAEFDLGTLTFKVLKTGTCSFTGSASIWEGTTSQPTFSFKEITIGPAGGAPTTAPVASDQTTKTQDPAATQPTTQQSSDDKMAQTGSADSLIIMLVLAMSAAGIVLYYIKSRKAIGLMEN